jgi:nucleotide-binding universal stress UspA family protein
MSDHVTHQGIVAGVDGSAASMMAALWAAREAAMRNVPLTLVHVVFAQSWASLGFGKLAAQVGTELDQQQEELGRQIMADTTKVIEDSLEVGARPPADSEVLLGPPVPTLVDLSKDAQMVVVGCRGRGLLDRVLLGSVSTGLVHHAHCPVAVIHNEAPLALQPSQLPVVVGVDGSPASESATAIAFDEASFRGVELIALHAWCDADVADIPSIEWSAQQGVAEEALAERLAGWQESYPDVVVHRRIVWSRPAHHLINQAESSQLVVVGSHGRGGFAGMLLGSVSTAVAQAARAPVIVARP